jgi:DNA (cytosine-5)-methyltransferase 1
MEVYGTSDMKFRLGELFSGPGGLGLGAKTAIIKINEKIFSIEHQWAIDYDQDSCETYKQNICPHSLSSVICEDVRKVDFSKLSKISALAFGFPCNDFSLVGKQKGFEGNFGALYTSGVKALKFFQPQWFVAENVSGLSSSNNGEAFKIILQELLETGYNLTVHLYKFEEYSIPQARHRIIIVGIRKDLDLIFHVPKANKILISAKEAIENPPISANISNHEFTNQSKIVIERLKYIKPGENAWNAKLPPHLSLNVKGAKLSHIYKRLNPDKPSYTVTGSGGGGTHIYHWLENRALTNRERARLQTFPDDFVFIGSKESVRKQIGMAVPVAGAKIIFSAILKTFAGISYPIDPPSFGYIYDQDDIFLENKVKSTKTKHQELNSVQLCLNLTL